jgi:hypothetical protein
MGNKASTPTQEKQKVIAHKYLLFDHIPRNSVVQSLLILTEHHTIHSVFIDIGTPIFGKEYKGKIKGVRFNLFGLSDFPLFLMDAKKEKLSITIMVSLESDKPLDLKVEPQFREVSPEEYSMIRHKNIVYPTVNPNTTLLFQSTAKDGCLEIRSV